MLDYAFVFLELQEVPAGPFSQYYCGTSIIPASFTAGFFRYLNIIFSTWRNQSRMSNPIRLFSPNNSSPIHPLGWNMPEEEHLKNKSWWVFCFVLGVFWCLVLGGVFLVFFPPESALKHPNHSPPWGKDLRTAPTLLLFQPDGWLITKYAAWKQLQHVLCLAQLIDSNTERSVFEEFEEGAEALQEVMKSCLGQRIPVLAVRRQSTQAQVHNKLTLTSTILNTLTWSSGLDFRNTKEIILTVLTYFITIRHNPGDTTLKIKSKIKRKKSAI